MYRSATLLASLAIDAAGGTELALRFYWTATTLVASVGPIDPSLEQTRARGLRLAVTRTSRGALTRAKSTSYAENMMAQEDAIALGVDDALLVNEDGIVLEAPIANIWWRTGDRLFTPSLELPILAGVTRSLLLELADAPVEEGSYPLEHLLAADEAFLTSSIREVMPVGAIDEKEFVLGPTAAALQRALRARARGEFWVVPETDDIRFPEVRAQLRRAVDMLCEPHLQLELELDLGTLCSSLSMRWRGSERISSAMCSLANPSCSHSRSSWPQSRGCSTRSTSTVHLLRY